jgi:hypothetical protein
MAIYPTRPDVLLRSEGLVALAVECTAYQHFSAGHWGWFALLFLVPDVSLLGYLRPASRAAAGFYNVVHCYVFPLTLGLLAWGRGSALAGQIALIWLAHISFDRSLGYGLKFPEAFGLTHIQRSAAIADKALQ